MTAYTEEDIRFKLATEERWVRRALIRLYERQTADEKNTLTTRNHNARGFQPCDAKWFSRLAQYAIKFPGRALSEKQLAVARKEWRGAPAICKYAGQLMQIMAEDAGSRSAGETVVPAAVVAVATTPAVDVNCQHCGEDQPGCRCERKAAFAADEAYQEMRANLAKMRMC